MRAARLLMALWTGASLMALPAPTRSDEAAAQQDEVAAATIRYRRKVFYEWWTAEIAPRIEFAEEHDYDANYGARFQMEFNF